MLQIAVERSERGITGFAVRGHAAYAPKGRDIVCAGVSALTQTTVLGLRRLSAAVQVREGADGELACRLPQGMPPETWQRCQDLLETMCLGLAAIAATYPRHVRLQTSG